MRCGDVFQVVFVQIGIEIRACLEKLLVILGTGEGGEAVRLQKIDWEFALDDFYVAQDFLWRVGGEADDVAGKNSYAGFFPLQQHLAVLGHFILLLASAEQGVRIDAFEADEHARDSGAARLLDETRQAVTHGIDLDDELEVQLLLLAHCDEAVEDIFPVGVAGEVVVGDEEAVDALSEIAANDLLDIVGGAAAGFAPLHVDNGAERTQERAAAAGIEGGDFAARALHAEGGKNRDGNAFE